MELNTTQKIALSDLHQILSEKLIVDTLLAEVHAVRCRTLIDSSDYNVASSLRMIAYFVHKEKQFLRLHIVFMSLEKQTFFINHFA